MVAARTVGNMGVLLVGGHKLIQVDSFFDGLAAQQAQNWLNQEGIPAFVEGANANSALYVGSALAGVKLLVAKEDQERARIVLRQYHSVLPDRTTWYCGECEEFNEPSFDLCWSCSKKREEVEAPAPLKNLRHNSETADDEPAESTLSVADIPRLIESGNPYQPPQIMLPAKQYQKPQLDDETEEIEKAEEVIQRAWRASILGLGLVFPIPILNTYSVMLLAGVDRKVPISTKSQRQFKLACLINLILVLAIGLAVSVVVIR